MDSSYRSLGRTTDGVVAIRPPEAGDAALLRAGRDEEFHRWLGPGADHPQPVGCIEVGGEVVGWVDWDVERTWLQSGEVNLGYNVFAAQRGNGYASRAVQLLAHHLSVVTDHHTATLLIQRDNVRSLALAARLGFSHHSDVDGNRYFKRPLPALTYSDGVVTLRRQRVEDIDTDLEAKDDAQIDWLWLPGQRETWQAMSAAEQRAHALRGLRANHDAFATGPKWTFSLDTNGNDYVAYADCDLANDRVPPGEANISYASHPAHRGRGYVTRAVRLVLRFLREHTSARRAHLIIDATNAASLRVAHAVGAEPNDSRSDDRGRTLIHHRLDL
jgi:RimJ/RimL family protein N-acetyltransferase